MARDGEVAIDIGAEAVHVLSEGTLCTQESFHTFNLFLKILIPISNLKRERSGSPPDRRRWCREPPAAVCGAGTAAAAARAPVDGLKRGAPL